jgi:hypothetical protein
MSYQEENIPISDSKNGMPNDAYGFSIVAFSCIWLFQIPLNSKKDITNYKYFK